MDVEKTIEFILDRHAKFFAGMERIEEKLGEFVEQQGQINVSLGKALLGVTEHIDRLTAAQAATDERLNRLAAATDERMNALIAVVDGIVRRPPPV